MPSGNDGLAARRIAVFLIAVSLAAAASRLILLPIHYSADPNEGWNAFHAVSAMTGAPLYPPAGSLIGNNYPPLSFYVVGLAGRLVGDPIVAGRIIALLSVLGIAALLPPILRRLGARGGVPLAGALLFLFLNATVLRKYLALNDPQWLGHLLMTGAVLVLLPRRADERPSPGRLVAASVLMLLGGMMKLNLVGWPLAVTMWLAWRHPRALGVWIGAGIIGVATATIICRLAFGPTFFVDAFEAARAYSVARIADRGWKAILIMAALIWWSWPFLRRWGDDRRLDLVRLAVLVTVPLGIIERGGAGVDINAHFEAAIALSLSAALALPNRKGGQVSRPVAGLLLAILATVGLVDEARELSDFPARHASWEKMRQRIAAIPGSVACEDQALCFWAGKPFVLDFFLYSQRARKAGAAPELDRALTERRFAAAEIDADRRGETDRHTDPILIRLLANMRIVSVDADGRRLLMPPQ